MLTIDILSLSAEAQTERETAALRQGALNTIYFIARNTTPSVRTFCHCLFTKSHIWSLSNTVHEKQNIPACACRHFLLLTSQTTQFLIFTQVFRACAHHTKTHTYLHTWHKQNSHLHPFCQAHTYIQMEIWPRHVVFLSTLTAWAMVMFLSERRCRDSGCSVWCSRKWWLVSYLPVNWEMTWGTSERWVQKETRPSKCRREKRPSIQQSTS